MIPLKDDNPTSSRPIATYLLIGLCVVVFLMQLSSQSYKTGQLFYSYGLIPSVLMGHDKLPMDFYVYCYFQALTFRGVFWWARCSH